MLERSYILNGLAGSLKAKVHHIGSIFGSLNKLSNNIILSMWCSINLSYLSRREGLCRVVNSFSSSCLMADNAIQQ